jgi:hypothetical protein
MQVSPRGVPSYEGVSKSLKEAKELSEAVIKVVEIFETAVRGDTVEMLSGKQPSSVQYFIDWINAYTGNNGQTPFLEPVTPMLDKLVEVVRQQTRVNLDVKEQAEDWLSKQTTSVTDLANYIRDLEATEQKLITSGLRMAILRQESARSKFKVGTRTAKRSAILEGYTSDIKQRRFQSVQAARSTAHRETPDLVTPAGSPSSSPSLEEAKEISCVNPQGGESNYVSSKDREIWGGLKKDIEDSYESLEKICEPVMNMPSWGLWTSLKSIRDFSQSDLKELKCLRDELEVASLLADGLVEPEEYTKNTSSDIARAAKEVATSRRVTRACALLKKEGDLEKGRENFRDILREVLLAFSDSSEHASASVVRLLTAIEENRNLKPYTWCVDSIRDEIKDYPQLRRFAKSLAKHPTSTDHSLIVETRQALTKLIDEADSNSAKALHSSDPREVAHFLLRKMQAISKSTKKEKGLFQFAKEVLKEGNVDTKRLAEQLLFLFRWFPQHSFDFRETLRSLVQLINQTQLKAVSPEIRAFICALAHDLQLDTLDTSTWSKDSLRNAFVFRASPHSSIGTNLDVKMQKSKIALDLGLTRLRESMKESERVHPIVIGTEWAFSGKNSGEFFSILDALALQSRNHLNVTYIPGSIAWVDPASGLCFNMLPIFEDGRLVFLYSKRHEKQDMDTIAKKAPGVKLRWAALEPGFKEEHDRFIRNISVMKTGETLSVEICNDHAYATAKTDYKAMEPKGPGVDIQLVIAHGTRLITPELIAVSLVGYLDHSNNAEVLATRVKRDQERTTLIAPQRETNTDLGIVGSLQTYQTIFPEIAPGTRTEIIEMSGKKNVIRTFDDVFQEIGRKFAWDGGDVKGSFLSHLTRNKDLYFPKGSVKIQDLKEPSDLALLLETISRRYTFSDEQDLKRFLHAVEMNEGSFVEQYQVFFHCLSDYLHRPVVVYNDLVSVRREIFMPDRSCPLQIPEDALEIGFSFVEKTFFPIALDGTMEFTRIIDKYHSVFREGSFETILKKLEAYDLSMPEASIAEEKAVGIVRARIQKILPFLKNVVALEDAFTTAFQEWNAGKKVDLSLLFSLLEEVEKEANNHGELKNLEGFKQLLSSVKAMRGIDTLTRFSEAKEHWGAKFHSLWVDSSTHRLVTGRALTDDLSHIDEALDELSDALPHLLPNLSRKKKEEIEGSVQKVISSFGKSEDIRQAAQRMDEILRST